MKKYFRKLDEVFVMFVAFILLMVILVGIGTSASNTLNQFLHPGSGSRDNVLEIGGTMNSLVGSVMNILGTLNIANITAGSETTTVIEGITNSITPTKSQVILNSTEAVTFVPGNNGASISTTTASIGDYITLISTVAFQIIFPAGIDHFVLSPSSPVIFNQWDVKAYEFIDPYWIHKSSAGNN